uniref:Transposase InsH N-terminal domain-containing protein n=1 Tax=blood disease bacterium R229 TaxID=741978 RepID=G2ZPG1_9RALS|nr:hypothetical protein BDB_110393 [blood disease bacterium R229]
MGPKAPETERDLFRQPLREQINLKHPLVRLADLIDWDRLSTAMSESFVSKRGRPGHLCAPDCRPGCTCSTRSTFPKEKGVWQWVENPYWQVSTGETYLQTEPPIDPSSLTRWRKRLGEARRGGAAGRDDRRGQACRRDQGCQRQTCHRRHDGHGESDCASDRFAAAGAVPRTCS